MKRIIGQTFLIVFGALCVMLFSSDVLAANYAVTKTADTNDGVCNVADCSLREAVGAANATAADDVIEFAISASDPNCSLSRDLCTFILTGGELTVSSASTAGSLTITTPTSQGRIISGNNASRVFFVDSEGNLTLIGITVSRGVNIGSQPGSSGGGGGIYNKGILTLIASLITSNDAFSLTFNNFQGYGGGVFNKGTVIMTDSTIRFNSAFANGGGIYNDDGTVLITRSTISGNVAQRLDGGGIFNVDGTATLINSTVSGNRADRQGAGGIYNDSGTINLTGVTVTENEQNTMICPDCGSGIINSMGTANLNNTIVAENGFSVSPVLKRDFSGTISSSSSYNLIGSGRGMTGITDGANGNQIGTESNPINPRLGPLADNGGPTQTHALKSMSPAIDKGKSFGLMTDQRHLPRSIDLVTYANAAGGDGTDIGAFEAQAAPNEPPDAQCRDVTVTLAPGTTTASADINDGSSDPDGDSLTFDYNPPGPYPVGQTLVTLTVDDGNGGTDSCTGTVTVLYQFKFFDYSDLLSSQQYFIQVAAGSNVAVRFSLSGFQGDPYSQPPTSQPISCTTKAPLGPATVIDRYAPDPFYSSLYDFYQTTWRTQTSWKNTCRRLTLYFKDGTTQSLDFYFK